MNIKVIGFIVFAIFASLFIGTEVAQGNVMLAVSVMVFIGVPIAILVIGKGVSYPAKLLLLLILGYAVTGKGFAYLAVVEPIYPGELVLGLMMIMMLLTLVGSGWRWFPKDSPITKPIIIFLAYSGFNLVWHFPEYKLLSIRDSALAYYMIFFFASYGAMKNIKSLEAAKKVATYCFVIAIITKLLILVVPGFLGELFSQALLRGRPIVNWHVDTMVAFIAGLLAYLYVKSANNRKILLIPILVLTLAVAVIGSKSAYFLVILAVTGYLFVCGRKGFTAIMVLGALFGVMSVIVASKVLNIEEANEMYDKFAEEFSSWSVGGEDVSEDITYVEGETGTTQWRLAWWSAITDDVMAENPMFGLGYGADINTTFISNYWGITDIVYDDKGQVAGTARYPHNVFFTVLGRLGIVGVILFHWLVFVILREAWRFAKFAKRQRVVDPVEIGMWAMIVGATANGYVQATFEPPFAAIPYWIVLGVLIRLKDARREQLIE